MSYTADHLRETAEIAAALDPAVIDLMAEKLAASREAGGRLFILGAGGGAGHASHAACDFRKLAGFEAYAPSDNVSELTARINDDGWEHAYVDWLRGSRLRSDDALLVFSVGGGDLENNVSPSLVRALELGDQLGCTICGVVGRDGGYTAKVSDACVLVPTVNEAAITTHTEAFQAVVWHLLITHPKLTTATPKWESMDV
jgi:D-sedoheptulose 7-phosphate isomerase